MNKTTLLSVLLVIVFCLSCMTFFSAIAEPDDAPQEATTAVAPTTEAPTTTAAPTTTQAPTTTAAPTTEAQTTVAPTNKKTTAKKSHFTDPTVRNTTVATPAETPAGIVTVPTTASATYETDANGQTKTTQEINTTTTTEPTTKAKNIVDYGSRFKPLKWISLFVMIACAGALIAINVSYKKKHPKNGKKNGQNGTRRNGQKPKLDPNAKFNTAPIKAPVQDDNSRDISSFSKKRPNGDFTTEFKKPSAKNPSAKPKPSPSKDEVFGTKNDDDDLYI